jgi:hypothetical protein
MADSFKPTDAMAAAARRGLRMRESSSPSNQGGTAVGLARARQFANQESVSIDVVRRTYSFLSRARTYYRPGKNTPGTQAYLMWGGPAGLVWAKNILAKLKQEKNDAS